MRRGVWLLLLLMPLHGALGQALWQTLPPAPVAGARTGHAQVNGISLYYAVIGHGTPVVLLHGGLANSDYWGLQVAALAPHHMVILMDSRGHGRSTRDARPYGYDLMADDVIGLLDTLHVAKADVVGWSDGAILGLDLAMRHPDRVGRIFAFAANTQTSGVRTAWRRTRRSPDLSSVPARNTRGCRRRRSSTTRSSRRSARCGRASRTGRMPSCKRYAHPCWWWMAITTRRSSARTPSTSRRPSLVRGC